MRRKLSLLFLLLPLFIFADSFLSLMGENTPSWKHVQTTEDKNNVKFYENIYTSLDKKALKEKKIPSVLHLIHLGARGLNKENLKKASSWQKKHPDWQVIFWTDRKHKKAFKNVQERYIDELISSQSEEYFSTSNYKEKEMLLAFEILKYQGGVFVSLDSLDLAKFSDEFLSYDFFTTLSLPLETMASSSVYISAEMIGSKTHHPIIEKAIKLCKNKWQSISNAYVENDNSSHAYRYMHRILYSLEDAFKEKNNAENTKDIAFPFYKIFPKEKKPFDFTQEMKNWVKLDYSIEDKINKNLDATQKNLKLFYISLIVMTVLMALIMIFLLFKKRRSPSH